MSDKMPDEIWVSTDGVYMYPSTGLKAHGSVKYTRADLAPSQPQAVGDDRGEFHNAFWEAFKTLEEPLRKRFSLHTGRTFANTLFDEFLRRKKNANIKD